jgi:hypothetical protein
VVLEIVAPPADTEETRRAYRQLAESASFNPRAELGV